MADEAKPESLGEALTNRRSLLFARNIIITQNHIDIDVHCCSITIPTIFIMTSRSYLFVCTLALLLSPALSWNLPFRRNKAVKTTPSPLYYQNGADLDAEGLFASTAVIVPEATAVATAIPLASTTNMEAPRAMDLPKHSPPKEVLQRQKAMLDAEILVGRAAMVAALVLFVNEFFTGNSMMDQVTSLFR